LLCLGKDHNSEESSISFDLVLCFAVSNLWTVQYMLAGILKFVLHN
jgi:hypothetical protein